MPTTNGLRGALKEKGWSHARLAAELRRHATAALPKTESLSTQISRWVNNHQQPDDFYRELLAQALGRPRAELFSDEGMRVEFPPDAQPWRLARALEAASIGQTGVAALEQTVGEFARSYPSTPPTVLAGPVLEHFRDVVRLLEGPLPGA
jgi:transcriptional regulator with XRE-family HTH domain